MLYLNCLNVNCQISNNNGSSVNKTTLFNDYFNSLFQLNDDKNIITKMAIRFDADTRQMMLDLNQYCHLNDLSRVKYLNLSYNNIRLLKNYTILAENITDVNLTRIQCKFESLKYLDLSNNQLTRLHSSNFKVFEIDQKLDNGNLKSLIAIELLKLDNNRLKYIKHDTFDKFYHLKYLDLSHNQLKYIHSLQFSHNLNMYLLDLTDNSLEYINIGDESNGLLQLLKYFYINRLNCSLSCKFLLELHKKSSQIIMNNDFKCEIDNNTGLMIEFKSLNDLQLKSICNLNEKSIDTRIHVSYNLNKELAESSVFTFLDRLAHRWFTWYVWPEDTLRTIDILPKIANYLNLNKTATNNIKLRNLFSNRFSLINITCTGEYEKTNETDSNYTLSSLPAINFVWKTPYGYFMKLNNTYFKFNIFDQMRNLTNLHEYMRFKTAINTGSSTINEIYVSQDENIFINNISSTSSQLIVTNFRQRYTGEYTCIAYNSFNFDYLTFNIQVRVGVMDYFFYNFVVFVAISILLAIIGIVFCIICERNALDNFPMTPPVFPTPFDTVPTTPPNFDFNQWMTTTATNIQGTLDQASKKLRKGFEKASVTVKSLGVTSTAYFYSVYEHGTQRLNTIKSYRLPTLPHVSLPAMRYPNQLVTRMGRLRTGVADVFLQFKEFCGSSDLTHTASIATIESDTNASNAVGYIVGKISHMDVGMLEIAEEPTSNQRTSLDDINEIGEYEESDEPRTSSKNDHI